jgi:hypothetical protein
MWQGALKQKWLKELGVKQGIPVFGLRIQANLVNYPEFT